MKTTVFVGLLAGLYLMRNLSVSSASPNIQPQSFENIMTKSNSASFEESFDQAIEATKEPRKKYKMNDVTAQNDTITTHGYIEIVNRMGKARRKGSAKKLKISPYVKRLTLKKKPIKKTMTRKVNWLRLKRGCKAGELYAKVPGNKFSTPKCLPDPIEKQSSTKQLPSHLFTRTTTVSSTSRIKKGDALVKVYTLPIGQGDCNIIECNGGKNVIIFDCGSSGAYVINEDFIGSLLYGAETVTIIISHGHADHYRKIVLFLNSLVGKIKTILVGGELDDYPAYIKNIATNDVSGDTNFCNNKKIKFEFLQGNFGSTNKNEKGLLMKLSCNTCQSSLLFTGDMEGPTAQALATNKKYSNFLQSTHYKMAHHGASEKANEEDWLKAISPVEVHVSHMYNHGSYHHPRCEAFNRLMSVNSVGMASAYFAIPHDLTCFGEKDEGYKAYDQQVYHRIFSTAPRYNKICLIVLSFIAGEEAVTEYYCQEMV